MSKKFIWMPVLLIITVLISGCIFDKDSGTTPHVKLDLIPTTNLPVGFTYMGVHEVSFDINNSSMNATEGVYRYNNKDDVYILVIKSDNPGALMNQYKLQLKKQFKTDFNPFEEISFNGHKATKVTDYSIVNGQQKPNYAIIWAAGKAMILVSSSTADARTVIALATATGS
ncbi:MAG: hypothetical protein KKD69_04790 [Euryarchaeota archaeon]|nr:hypothetical protein [Euryarchaeota archaeon]MBU4491762.1 hypothetical protein [Euryarchaeota archaeon]MCG2727571.1 hypothetical protein [Candidatus Methanoperedenaceae archaeon]